MRLSTSLLTASLILSPLFAFADCSFTSPYYSVIHGSCITGITTVGTGLYVKEDMPGVGSAVMCMNDALQTKYSVYAFISAYEEPSELIGNLQQNYYACKTQLGDDCQLVGSDHFTVVADSTVPGGYSATPKNTEIHGDFEPYLNDPSYEKCSVFMFPTPVNVSLEK